MTTRNAGVIDANIVFTRPTNPDEVLIKLVLDGFAFFCSNSQD
jgi:hypothetical protein